MSGWWTISYVALWIVAAGLCFVVMGLLRQLGLIQMRLGANPGPLLTEGGLPRGASCPDFEALDAETGQMLRLSEFQTSRLALVFVSPSCVACRDLVPHLNQIERNYRDEVNFLVVCHGTLGASRQFRSTLKLNAKPVVDSTDAIASSYDVTATPFCYLLDRGRTVLIRGIVNTWPQLESLLREEGTVQTQPSPWQAVGSARSAGEGVVPLEALPPSSAVPTAAILSREHARGVTRNGQ